MNEPLLVAFILSLIGNFYLLVKPRIKEVTMERIVEKTVEVEVGVCVTCPEQHRVGPTWAPPKYVVGSQENLWARDFEEGR